MSTYIHLKKEQQQIMPLFNGAFIENKPIPFPDMNGTTAYSNLFYWANLEANQTSEFPLHPHEGFEIMTFVFKGSIEHFDTATNIWTPLKAGGVQVIHAGSGVQHAERIIQGTQMFQIWFDPDFSKSLRKKASYKDYPNACFKSVESNSYKRISYVGEGAPIDSETPLLEIDKYNFSAGEYEMQLNDTYTYSCYVLNGEVKVGSDGFAKDCFLAFNEEDNIKFSVDKGVEIFVIKSPTAVEYRRFIERY